MTDMTQATGTALALPEPTALAVLFKAENGLDPLLARIEAEATAEAAQYSPETAKGRDALKSVAFRVVKSKTELERRAKELTEQQRREVAAVNAGRNAAVERLDALRDKIKAPAIAWEAAEADRIEKHKTRLAAIQNAAPETEASEAYRAIIARIEAMQITDAWQEFAADAGKAKDATLARLLAGLDAAEVREAQEAEIARLRAEAAAREEADRLRREAEEAEAARIAAEKAEAERLARIEREKQEAAERAAKAAEERAKAEAERTASEAAEREAALKRAAEEQAAQHQRELQEAKRREEAAAQAERDRIARENAAAEAARQKRAADEAHRAKIRADIAAALATMAGRATPEAIADALMAGLIPHCEVRL